VAAGIVELGSEEIERFLAAQVVGRIGVHAGGVTYVVPVIYAFADGALHVFTVEGQKVQMMREQPQVCFEVDEYDVDGRGSWRSVIVQGRYEELEGAEAERVLALLTARFRGERGSGETSGRRPRGDGRPGVAFRIAIESATGRAVTR
jgi:nitroimidazol reductase NimA-like FMN-containing flavoprotein (pyridoxamine 5'-phosphate oxidase superfamily)